MVSIRKSQHLGPKRNSNPREPDTRDLVTISIYRADPCTVKIVKPRRRFDPIDGRPNAVRSGRKGNPRRSPPLRDPGITCATLRWRRTNSNLRSRSTRPTFPKTGLRRLPAASAPPIMRRGRNWSWAGANTSFTCSYKRVPHIYRTFCLRLVRGVTTSPGARRQLPRLGGLGAGRVFRDEPPDSWRVIASRTERQPRPRSRRDGRRALRD